MKKRSKLIATASAAGVLAVSGAAWAVIHEYITVRSEAVTFTGPADPFSDVTGTATVSPLVAGEPGSITVKLHNPNPVGVSISSIGLLGMTETTPLCANAFTYYSTPAEQQPGNGVQVPAGDLPSQFIPAKADLTLVLPNSIKVSASKWAWCAGEHPKLDLKIGTSQATD